MVNILYLGSLYTCSTLVVGYFILNFVGEEETSSSILASLKQQQMDSELREVAVEQENTGIFRSVELVGQQRLYLQLGTWLWLQKPTTLSSE